jgi:hypothetical protein
MKHPEHKTTAYDNAIRSAAAGEACEPSKVQKKLDLELPLVRDRIEYMLARKELRIVDGIYQAIDQDIAEEPAYAQTDSAE